MPDQTFKHRNLRHATRRFEMKIHEGVPETPQPMYQESTHGKTPSRLTGQASDSPNNQPSEGRAAAIYVLRNGEIVSELPDE